jgi:hypothetical protein
MRIDAKCLVCKNQDRRRVIELAWNGGVSIAALVRVFEAERISALAFKRHFDPETGHFEGDAAARRIEVEEDKPMRERVYDIQRAQVEELERRIYLAQSKAARMNALHAGDEDWTEVDWSDFYDILDKNAQQAINTILKTQGLIDNREKTQGELKLGLFDAMSKAGLAPKALVGGKAVPMLTEGDEDD